MAAIVWRGAQDFEKFRRPGYFYIDKTAFIREWWKGTEGTDDVTLVTRPRRFGKSLMLSTIKCFFSTEYAGRSDLFEGLDVWQDEEMRELQGTYPVISLNWSDIMGKTFESLQKKIARVISWICADYKHLNTSEYLNDAEREAFLEVCKGNDTDACTCGLELLSKILYRKHGKRVIILLDEYDSPMQEAWINGFWTDAVDFLRELFNTTFKKNEFLEKAVLTGITRISKESIFSDMNNLGVYSITVPEYATSFGFTEEEVFAAMDERGLTDKAGVKAMYDGYRIGNTKGIYNPWSICSYLKDPRLIPWWSNTSANALAGQLLRDGSIELKHDLQSLLKGDSIQTEINEQIVYDDLGDDISIWSLLLAAGYLKIDSTVEDPGDANPICALSLVNGEVRRTMAGLVKRWFSKVRSYYNKFLKSLLTADLDGMNEYMNKVALNCFSNFDTGGTTAASEPERFYHGFVLGMLVELRNSYILTSNRESGDGRYDVMLEPRNPKEDHAFIIEFKVHKPDKERSLAETVASALAQIEEKRYDQTLIERGIPADRIHKYGLAFKGKQVLIG